MGLDVHGGGGGGLAVLAQLVAADTDVLLASGGAL